MQYLHIPIMEDGKLALSNFCPNMKLLSTSCYWESYSWHDKPYTNYVISDDDYCEFDSEYDLCLDYPNFEIIL